MPPRVGLDRKGVVDAAGEMADAAKGAEVSLADLAARLGVRTPSLYNHVAGQTGLRRELALLSTRELGARLGRAAIGKERENAIIALAHAYRAFARERPGLYAAGLRAPDPADDEHQAASEEILNVLRAVLEPYGLREVAVIHSIRAFRSLLHGFVALEIAGGFGLPIDLDESFLHLMQVYIRGLPERDEPKVG